MIANYEKSDLKELCWVRRRFNASACFGLGIPSAEIGDVGIHRHELIKDLGTKEVSVCFLPQKGEKKH